MTTEHKEWRAFPLGPVASVCPTFKLCNRSIHSSFLASATTNFNPQQKLELEARGCGPIRTIAQGIVVSRASCGHTTAMGHGTISKLHCNHRSPLAATSVAPYRVLCKVGVGHFVTQVMQELQSQFEIKPRRPPFGGMMGEHMADSGDDMHQRYLSEPEFVHGDHCP